MDKDIWKSGRLEAHSSLRTSWTELTDDDLELDLERLARVFEDYSAEQTAFRSAGDHCTKRCA